MKKIIFKMAVALMALSLIMVSCQEEPIDRNDPNRPPAPIPATMTASLTPGIITAPDSSVLLTATAELAETFLWQRGGAAIGGQTKNTFYLRATGTFPDTARIRVAGVNPSGTGLFTEEQTFIFTPWRIPSKATIAGENNVCPTPVVTLTARAVPATQFIWYRDGEVMDTTTSPTRTVRLSGAFSVRGINNLGEGEMSDPLDIIYTECAAFEPEGFWTGTGVCHWDGPWTPWNDTIVPMSSFEGHEDNDSTYVIVNAFGLGRILFIERDVDGNFFFPAGRIVANLTGNETLRQVGVWHNDAGSLVFVSAGRIALSISEDHSTFRMPANVTFAGGATGVRGGIGLVIFNPDGAPRAWVEATLDYIYTRPATTATMWAPAKAPASSNIPIVLEAETIRNNGRVRR